MVRVRTGASGAAEATSVRTIDYDEFGNQTVTWNTGAISDRALPIGFAGGLYDQDTGFVHFGARDYDPSVGRWISKDPIRFGGQQANLYVYVHNNPTNEIDPSGLFGNYIGYVLSGGSPWAPIAGALLGLTIPSGGGFSVGVFNNFNFSTFDFTMGLYFTKTTTLDATKSPFFCNAGTETGLILKNTHDFKGSSAGVGVDLGPVAGNAAWSPGSATPILPATIGGNIAIGPGAFAGPTFGETSILGLSGGASGIHVAR